MCKIAENFCGLQAVYKNSKTLCLFILGLAVRGLAAINFAGKSVVWIIQCLCKTTKKADEIGKEILQSSPAPSPRVSCADAKAAPSTDEPPPSSSAVLIVNGTNKSKVTKESVSNEIPDGTEKLRDGQNHRIAIQQPVC